MALLTIHSEGYVPGSWIVRSEHPGALAATSDVLVHGLGLQEQVLTCWALHPHEQDELYEHTYREERLELGTTAQVSVIELPRPRQAHVVWIDRYHLIVTSAPPHSGTRLLGLYAGTRGEIVLWMHHTSVTGAITPAAVAAAEDHGAQWDTAHVIDQCSVALRYDPRRPQEILVRAPFSAAASVQQALSSLPSIVAHW